MNRREPIITAPKGGAQPVRRKFAELPPTAQAGIRCGEAAFWEFIKRYLGFDERDLAIDPAPYVRLICNVASRAEMNTNAEAAARWRDLEARYQVWLTGERYKDSVHG